MGMALEGRAELAQRDDVVERAETGDAERHIKRRRLVAGRPENAVAIGPVGMFGIVLGRAQIERRGNVHDGERAAGVARARRAQRDQVVAAHELRRVAQFVDGIFLPHLPGGCISKRHCRSPLRRILRGKSAETRTTAGLETGATRLQVHAHPRVDARQRFYQVLHGIGDTEAQIALAIGAKRSAGKRGHAGLFEQRIGQRF